MTTFAVFYSGSQPSQAQLLRYTARPPLLVAKQSFSWRCALCLHKFWLLLFSW